MANEAELSILRKEVAAIDHALVALERRAAVVTTADAEQLMRDALPIFGRTSAVQTPYIDLRPRRPGEDVPVMPDGFEDVYVRSHALRERASAVVDRCHEMLGWRARP